METKTKKLTVKKTTQSKNAKPILILRIGGIVDYSQLSEISQNLSLKCLDYHVLALQDVTLKDSEVRIEVLNNIDCKAVDFKELKKLIKSYIK